ncbi:hypothetical protein SASPL_109340 [Salvia splendens]|uniref:Uncharacterized protein n=1 Tax=Salvia splendens TaxID=180675 RepID=A0A8X9A707_SALSN|nr:hypothetical protein SASPL_109340 [Salvia splendens]
MSSILSKERGDYGSAEHIKAGILAANGLIRKHYTIPQNPTCMVPSFLESGAHILVTSLIEEGGEILTFEGTRKKSPLKVILRVRKPQFYWKVATGSDLGFADAYIDGDIYFHDTNEGLLNFLLLTVANAELNYYTSNLNKGRQESIKIITFSRLGVVGELLHLKLSEKQDVNILALPCPKISCNMLNRKQLKQAYSFIAHHVRMWVLSFKTARVFFSSLQWLMRNMMNGDAVKDSVRNTYSMMDVCLLLTDKYLQCCSIQTQILALGFDEKFIRTWEYYFDYAAAGFKYCIVGNYQIVFTRPGDVAAFGSVPYNLLPSVN